MKKSIFLFFAAILCAMTANAYNQSAVDLYFDNSEAKWSSCYVYIGHSTWTSCYPLTRVSGTQYLWKLAKADFNGGSAWNGATGWVLCYEKWWDSNGESIDKYTWHGEKNVTKKRTSAWSASYIYKTNGTVSVTSEGNTINAYNTTTVSKKNYTVTINTVEGGTLTVKDYDNNAVATGASKIHLTVLKFSATPASGYVLDAVEINDGTNTTTIAAADLATKTHTLTSAVTITPVWRATTSTVTVTATATNGTVTGGGVVEEGTSVTLTATPADGYKFVNWTVGGAEVSTANPYTFTAEEDVTVVANFEELPKTTVYFVNTPGWTDVKAYAYSPANASWPGVAATKEAEKIGDFDVYSYTATEGKYANVIFNGNSGQTADLTWSEGVDKYYIHGYNKNTGWYTKAEAEAILVVPVEYDYVYFINTDNWAKVNIYTWTPEVAGWPGAAMTKEAEQIAGKDVYSYKVVKGSTFGGMLFNNGDGTQTGDLVWQAGKYYMYSTNKWYDTKEDAEGALAGPATVVLHGNFVKADWGDTDAFELSADEKTATLTVLIKAGNYEFGVKLNNVWTSNGKAFTKTNNEHVIEAGSGNLTLNADITGNYVFTWTYETNTLTVTYPTEEVVVETNYYVTGTFNNNEPADANYKMTLEDEVYKATVGLKEGENKLKITDGSWDNTWGYGQLGANYQEVSDPSDFNNILITLDEDKNIVVIFDATAGKITFEGLTEKTPVEDYYTIVGVTAITGVNWDPANEDNKMTKDGEAYTLTKTSLKLEAGNYEYKVAKNGAWGDGEYPNNGTNEKVTIAENGEYTIVYTYTVGTSLTAVATKTGEYTPDKPVYTVAGDAALCGTNWKADDTTNDMTDNGDGTFTWTKTGVKLTGDAGFKVVKNHDFGVAYPADNWVIKIADYKGAAIYTVTITFTESSQDIAVTLTKTGDAAPAVISYVLMGVNGDWTNGIALTQNPGNADEYVLENQVIIKATDAIKVVTLTDGQATAWCGNVDTWSNATYTADGDGNIVLEDGIYTFYFKKNDNLIYINQTGYARNVTNKYGTICLPYASASTSGATFYEVVGKEDGKVYLGSVNTLAAGVPYIFEKSANQIKVVYTGDKKDAGSANGLVGTFADNTTVPNDAYILYGGAFCTNNDPTKPNKINAYRAYLDLSAVEGGKPQQMPGRKYIGMDVQGENEATGFENIVAPEGQTIKAIVNGQLVIIRGGEMYNVQGQKL